MILILGKDDATENGENPVLMLYANVGLDQSAHRHVSLSHLPGLVLFLYPDIINYTLSYKPYNYLLIHE